LSLFYLDRISVKTETHILLENLTLSFNSNKIIGITGPSGIGKTTFLKLFNRLWEPSSGTIYYREKPINTWDTTILRREVSLLFQEPALFGQKVKDDLFYPFSLSRFSENPPKEEELIKALEIMSFSPSYLEKNSSELSGGEKQRIALIRSLLLKPKVLLLDEPTSALDEDLSKELITKIHNIHPPELILFISHDPVLTEKANNVYLFQDKKLVQKEGVFHGS